MRWMGLAPTEPLGFAMGRGGGGSGFCSQATRYPKATGEGLIMLTGLLFKKTYSLLVLQA